MQEEFLANYGIVLSRESIFKATLTDATWHSAVYQLVSGPHSESLPTQVRCLSKFQIYDIICRDSWHVDDTSSFLSASEIVILCQMSAIYS